MNVVVAGLSPREEAAFGIFLGRSMKDWAWQSAPAGRGAVLPKADLLVADLVALGLAQWSEAAEADLLRLLQGSPAVLLVPSHDRTWAAMDAGVSKQHAMVWLTKPYGTEDMRAALQKAAEAVPRSAPALQPAVAPRPVAKKVAPVAPLASAVLRATVSQPPRVAPPVVTVPAAVRRPVATVPGPAAAVAESPGLSAAELQTRLDAQAEPGRHVFLRKLSDMLALDRPFEARFTVQNSLIVHPADGWVASNTPMMVIQRVCQSDALASAVGVRDIDGAQAEERAQRLGMPLRELDTFLWELAAAALDKQP